MVTFENYPNTTPPAVAVCLYNNDFLTYKRIPNQPLVARSKAKVVILVYVDTVRDALKVQVVSLSVTVLMDEQVTDVNVIYVSPSHD